MCLYQKQTFSKADVIKALLQLKLGRKGAIEQHYWHRSKKRVVDGINFYVSDDELWTITPIDFKPQTFTFKLIKNAKEFPYYYTTHVLKQLFCGYSCIGNTDCKQIARQVIRPRNDYYAARFSQDNHFKRKYMNYYSNCSM